MSYQPKLLTIAACSLLISVGYFVWQRAEKYSSNVDKSAEFTMKITYDEKAHRQNFKPIAEYEDKEEIKKSLVLSLPAGPIVANNTESEIQTQRVISDDDAILAAGGVIGASAQNPEEKIKREKRLKSIAAKDWQELPDLLVNEIRSARGFQIPQEQVEAFLAGTDRYGWTVGQRNWIGDEMMTMLRQEVPQDAYRIFQKVLADENAPDAMRDYSIQHISHMIAANQIGSEGVAVIRAALDSGDPIYASTALVSLHRLSATQPQWISPEQVAEMAKRLENSTDQRTQLTAKAIGEEWGKAKR